MVDIRTKDTYTQNIPYLIGNTIREYDIRKANINILLYKGVISKQTYDYFFSLDNKERKIRVGYLQRDNPSAKEALTKGFKEIRDIFYTTNSIEENQILAVRKDAIFLINKIPSVTKFKNIEFINKNEYNAFFKINSIEYYYYLNIYTKEEKLDIKGLGDVGIYFHWDYMINSLRLIFKLIVSGNLDMAIHEFQNLYKLYCLHKLPIQYYRELNSQSKYRLNKTLIGSSVYLDGTNATVGISDIDGSYNLNIMRDLFRILLQIKERM